MPAPTIRAVAKIGAVAGAVEEISTGPPSVAAEEQGLRHRVRR